MTHLMQGQQYQQYPSVSGPANTMFQPGYAGTNPQDVRSWNQGGYAQAPATPTPTYGMSMLGGAGGAQSMFQPGFANTNVQEVRQLNSGYPAPQQSGYSPAQQTGYMQAPPAYQQPMSAQGSIFSPGFAGTNTQEVQSRNNSFTGQTGYAGNIGYSGNIGYTSHPGNMGYTASTGGNIFSPGFAGTNPQDVRHLNQSGYIPAQMMNSGYGMQAQQAQQPQQQQMQAQQPQQQQMQAYGSPLGTGAQSVFTPGFAGTNNQEVRSLNAGQAAPHTGSIFPGTF